MKNRYKLRWTTDLINKPKKQNFKKREIWTKYCVAPEREASDKVSRETHKTLTSSTRQRATRRYTTVQSALCRAGEGRGEGEGGRGAGEICKTLCASGQIRLAEAK